VSESLPMMKPRDVITPTATLLGLIVTALGILLTLADESEKVIVRNFAFIFITVVGLFVCAVIFTVFSSLLKKTKLWSCALIFYIVGWAFLGTIIILTLVGYAYGVEILQFQLPQFNLELVSLVSALVSILVGIVSFFVQYRKASAYRKHISELSRKVEVWPKERDEAITELKFESLDLNDSLVILRSDIERELRGLARLSGIRMRKPYPIRKVVTDLKQKDVLSPELAYSILFVYNVCSKVVHGEVIPEKDAQMIRELGINILINLRKISEKRRT